MKGCHSRSWAEPNNEACGLNKLTRDEQESILGLMTAGPAQSFLEESAFSRLENDGWTQVNVLGTVPKGSEHEGQYLLVLHHSEFFTLDPSIVPYTPDPGLYWAKINSYSWTLLCPHGEEGNFWARDPD